MQKKKKITAYKSLLINFFYRAVEVCQGWHTKIDMKHRDIEIQNTKCWYCPGYYKVKSCS